jgi:folate-binding protein YgfZ
MTTLMGMSKLTWLDDRAVVAVSGEDRVAYLQGLVSNDVTLAAPGRAVWAALLTPQGKWLADFFIHSDGDRLLLDVEAGQAAMLVQKLTRFRLRAKVAIAPAPLLVHVGWGGTAPPGAVADPRLPEAGWRMLADARLPATTTPAEYDLHRLRLGLPDGSRDMEAEKTTLLEANFDALNGVSWTKGCYMGQELTARTKYRGLLKRHLVPVRVHGPLPAPGTPVLSAASEVGTIRSGRDGCALALLRNDATGPLRCGEAAVTVDMPAWMAAQPS